MRSSRVGWGAVAGLVLIVVLSGIAAGARSHAPAPSPANGIAAGHASCGAYFCFATPIHHIVEIVMENLPATNVLQAGPFEVHLAAQYGYASHSYGACHPSEPNYYALTMGFTAGECGNGTDQMVPGSGGGGNFGNNIADLLETRGLTWGAFAESMPTPCDPRSVGEYDAGHNPFVRAKDIFDNPTRCDAHVRNFGAWKNDVKSGTIPNFAFIIPNLLDDGHDTSVAWGDHFLHDFLSPLLNASWAKSTLFVITYDEGEPGPAGVPAGYCAGTNGHACVKGGQIFTAFVSPYTRGAGNYTSNVTHYNVLTTEEWLLSLHDCGRLDDPSKWFPPMFGMFDWTPAFHHPNLWP